MSERDDNDRQMGEIIASLKYIEKTIDDIKKDLGPLPALVAEHEKRLSLHDKDHANTNKRFDDVWTKLAVVIVALSTIAGAIVYVVRGIG